MVEGERARGKGGRERWDGVREEDDEAGAGASVDTRTRCTRAAGT